MAQHEAEYLITLLLAAASAEDRTTGAPPRFSQPQGGWLLSQLAQLGHELAIASSLFESRVLLDVSVGGASSGRRKKCEALQGHK